MKIHIPRKTSGSLGLIILTSSLSSLLIGVHGFPQWVWNREAIDNSRLGNNNNNQFFAGHSSNIPQSPSRGFSSNSQKEQITIVNGQSRLFIPSAISSVSNSLQNIGGAGPAATASNAISGLFGSVLQSLPQLATQAISGIFNGGGGSTLPIKDPGDINTGVSTPVTGACRCVTSNTCFLPSKPSGSCEGGKVKCCSTSRTVFPDEDSSSSSKNERTITQRELRRGLLKNILKGSGSVVDDTLDFILQPFLSKEDQLKIATRVVDDQ